MSDFPPQRQPDDAPAPDPTDPTDPTDPPGIPPPVPEADATGSGDAEPHSSGVPHPLLVAAGALAAGVVVSKVLATPAARRIARDLSSELLRQLGTAPAARRPEQPPWNEIVERFRPQVTDYAKKMLADMLGKKE